MKSDKEKLFEDVSVEDMKKFTVLNKGWNPVEPTASSDYLSLKRVLTEAHNQASQGKGKERHANSKPFHKQPICEIGRMVGTGYNLGQAMKKAQESQTLLKIKGKDAAKAELLGAINYLASAVILIEEMEN